MKNTLIAFFIFGYLIFLYYANSLLQIVAINSAILFLILLIEDAIARKYILNFLIIIWIIVFIFMIIGFYNHGRDFDMTYKNIF